MLSKAVVIPKIIDYLKNAETFDEKLNAQQIKSLCLSQPSRRAVRYSFSTTPSKHNDNLIEFKKVSNCCRSKDREEGAYMARFYSRVLP